MSRLSARGRERMPWPGLSAALFALASLLALPVLFVAGSGCADDPPISRPTMKRGLIVLGIDGLDPVLSRQYMREGRMPNLARLAERGRFVPLGTSNPPQSPVAWSTFITGQGSEGHGIYDFVHRDPDELSPYLSTSRTRGPDTVLTLGDFAVPLDSGSIELLRRGRAFWQVLEDHGVPATMVKIPANFPPAESRMNESLSGMGTPDLLGTYGTFNLFTDDPAFAQRSLSGGVVHLLDFGQGQKVAATLDGPANPMSASGTPMRVSVDIARDRERPVALIRVGDTQVIMQPGEWSRWIRVGFDPGLLGSEVSGMVRLYLGSIRPHLKLYVSPINLDPEDPAMPISSPARYAEDLAHDVGRFYTQGMAEDTKALIGGALSDDEFLAQADLVYEERLQLFERELERFDGGVLFFYFSSVDQVSHVFWRAIEPDAKPADARYAYVIPELYDRADQAIGRALERAGADVDVIVMSDHGFAPYRYQVHLNTWLAQRSYLALLPPDKVQPGPLGHIDWANTQAYALGLNQLFVNLQGREAHGVVPESDYEQLVRQLARELESFRDPETGARVVTEAVRPIPGSFPGRIPDILVGYNRGYRSSDASAMGAVGERVIERNRSKWSGDHCMHPSHVPGIFASTRAMDPSVEDPTLADLAPTILEYFGVPVPANMGGRALFGPQEP
jgi:predicted AlkP superfamily phosphohydrolase/phosphomutase